MSAKSMSPAQSLVPNRRVFLESFASACGLVLASRVLRPGIAFAGSSSEFVTVVRFSDSGERLQTVQTPRIVKTDAEWRKQLTANEFDITRRADTEMALRLLLERFVQFANKIRLRDRLAQLLRSNRRRKCARDSGRQPWDGTNRHLLHGMRCASRPRFRRWTQAHAPPILHELRFAALRAQGLMKRKIEATLTRPIVGAEGRGRQSHGIEEIANWAVAPGVTNSNRRAHLRV